MKLKTKRKQKIVVRKTKSGRRYIVYQKKRRYLNPKNGITERDLIKYIIKRFTKRRTRRSTDSLGRAIKKGAIGAHPQGIASVQQSAIDKAVNETKIELKKKAENEERQMVYPALEMADSGEHDADSEEYAKEFPGLPLALKRYRPLFRKYKAVLNDTHSTLQEKRIELDRLRETTDRLTEENRKAVEDTRLEIDRLAEENRRLKGEKEDIQEETYQVKLKARQSQLKAKLDEQLRSEFSKYDERAKSNLLNRNLMEDDARLLFGSAWSKTKADKVYEKALSDLTVPTRIAKRRAELELELREEEQRTRSPPPMRTRIGTLSSSLGPSTSSSSSSSSAAASASATPQKIVFPKVQYSIPSPRSHFLVRDTSPKPEPTDEKAVRQPKEDEPVDAEGDIEGDAEGDQSGEGMPKPHETQELDDEVDRQLKGAGNRKKRILTDMLYSDQIDTVMSIYPEFLGTIAQNEIRQKILPRVKPHSRGGTIINTDKSDKSGRHWQSLFWDARPGGSNSIEFYDSYGNEPSVEILHDLKAISDKLDPRTPLRLKINRIKQQRSNSFTCGWMSIGFLNGRFQGKRFKDITKFSDIVNGEKNAQKLKKKYNHFQTI